MKAPAQWLTPYLAVTLQLHRFLRDHQQETSNLETMVQFTYQSFEEILPPVPNGISVLSRSSQDTWEMRH
jgi:hypothetical protein